MKRIVPVCIAALFLWGCSPSHPSVVDTSISDDSPVTGQKILLQVLSISDNYPMFYTWEAEGVEQGGQLVTGEATDNFAYWTTPDTEGTYTVSCTVTDEKDQSETHVFTIEVSPRVLDRIYDEGTVSTIEKQGEALIGGAWLSTLSEEVRYVSSSSDQLTFWEGAFITMYTGLSNLTYTLWGVEAGNVIKVQSSGESSYITCTDCEGINDLILDPNYLSVLYVGSDSGIYLYDSSVPTWREYLSGIKAYAFSSAEYAYAATTAGIYVLDTDPPTLKYPGDTCEMIAIDEGTSTPTIWHVTGGAVCEDGVPLASQPDEVACSLDIDLDGNIWCGKYRWDGSSWWTPPDPENILIGDIEKVVATTEGRIYFLTSSGALFLW